jgi:WD40 repeat protein
VYRTSPRFALVALAVGFASAAPGQVQKDRQGRTEPGLVVETGARMATCDQLTFTADGKRLLAAGDDKVVHSWPVTLRGLDADGVQTLRWPTWREQRGSIYALALSPDNGHVAIAGVGVRTAAVAVLNRTTGKVEGALTDVRGVSKSIRAVAFSPDGESVAYGPTDGSVWLWRWRSARANDARRLGARPPRDGKETNVVRFLTFLDATHVLSVAEQGEAVRWDVDRPGSASGFLDLQPFALRYVALSPDRRWLAAGTKEGKDVNHVLLRSLDGQAARDIRLESLEFPRCLAFDTRGERLAVAVSRLVRQRSGFSDEEADDVRIYDLTGRQARLAGELGPVYHADALAFSPRANALAVAGGEDHQVTLWDLDTRRPVGEPVRSPGSGLWGVGLSVDGRSLGFQEKRRAPHAEDPNERGSGPWRVFHLRKRQFTPGDSFQPVPPLPTVGGWKVRFTADQYRWEVEGPDGQRAPLPLDRERDSMPRCYTFLKPAAGQPVRLVVGHYWGASIFQLGDGPPKRVRLLTGHQSEVMAVAPSADGKWLVTAARDQTIAAWSLDDFRFEPALGASFQPRQGHVFVTAVDAGSPAWEAGLVAGDEVVLLQAGRVDFAFDSEGLGKDLPAVREHGGAERCVAVLRDPQPGKELLFYLRRQGEKDIISTLTSVKQRPLWRFFPTRPDSPQPNEWVLWMWQNYYYDTSTNGDFFVGWLVNPDLVKDYTEPTFHRAEAFRQRFQHRDVIDKLLATQQVKAALEVAEKNSAPLSFNTIEPPRVSLAVAPRTVRNEDPVVTVEASARVPANPDQQVVQVDLWVNEYRIQTYTTRTDAFRQSVRIPRAVLRAGPNEVMLQAYNAAGGRTDLDPPAEVRYDPPSPPAKPRLHVLLVGVSKYDQPKLLPPLPFTGKDVDAMEGGWGRQKRNNLYQDAVVLALRDPDANRKAVLAALRDLEGRVGPDDRLVVFFSGHGDLLPGSDTFVFCCPDYDRRRFQQTGITARDLYDALARVPCRKVLFLDACHAGDAATDTSPVRGLTPGARGLIVLCACDRSQEALGNARYGSLFTYAVAEALDRAGGFSRADTNQDQVLDAAELAAYVRARLPELITEIKAGSAQTPTYFPVFPPPLPLAAP